MAGNSKPQYQAKHQLGNWRLFLLVNLYAHKKETVQTLRCQNSKVKVVVVVVLRRLFSVSCKMSLFSNSKFKSSFKVVVRMPTNTMTGTWEDLSCPTIVHPVQGRI